MLWYGSADGDEKFCATDFMNARCSGKRQDHPFRRAWAGIGITGHLSCFDLVPRLIQLK